MISCVIKNKKMFDCPSCKVELVESEHYCDYKNLHCDPLLQCPECEDWFCIDCDEKWLSETYQEKQRRNKKNAKQRWILLKQLVLMNELAKKIYDKK